MTAEFDDALSANVINCRKSKKKYRKSIIEEENISTASSNQEFYQSVSSDKRHRLSLESDVKPVSKSIVDVLRVLTRRQKQFET